MGVKKQCSFLCVSKLIFKDNNNTTQAPALPFAAGGVTEILGVEGEGPTRSSGVFPAPSAPGLGEDCEGPAGLRTSREEREEKEKRRRLINGPLSAPTGRVPSVSRGG